MQAFISLFRSNTHESELRKRDEEIKKLKDLLKRKQELDKRDKEIDKLKRLLEAPEESETETESDTDSESDSGSVYDPSEDESEDEDDEDEVCDQQHCSHCNELGHKTTTCRHRWSTVVQNLRCPAHVLREYV